LQHAQVLAELVLKTGVFVRIGAKNANLAAHDIAPVYDTSGYLAAELTL
jgi:hypothetical protein